MDMIILIGQASALTQGQGGVIREGDKRRYIIEF